MTRRPTVPPTLGSWGPTVHGGRRFRRLRRVVAVVAVVGVVAAFTLAGVGFALYRTAEANLVRRPVAALDQHAPTGPLNVLVVGSDSREGLTPEQLERYTLGTFEGQRSDTIILLSIPAGRGAISVLSFPRDLYVLDDGVPRKLTETFDGGPDAVVDAITDNFGIPIHHYVEVSVLGFLEVVDTVGGVELCLDEPLVDPKSGADLPAGCQELDATDALAYVRSRQGPRGDFERIERQQRFLQAMLAQLVETRTLVDLPRLFAVIEDVAGTVTTDDDLSVNTMRQLAEQLRGLADGTIPMTFVPGYARTLGDRSFVVAYEPGADAIFDDLANGRVLEPRGAKDERADVEVAVWTGGHEQGAATVVDTLAWSGFPVGSVGWGDAAAVDETTVLAATGHERQGRWVAATLGARLAQPGDAEVPAGSDVVVMVGEDARPEALREPPPYTGSTTTGAGTAGTGSGTATSGQQTS